MGRSPCCDSKGLKKGPWSPEEDKKLVDYIEKHGRGNWKTLPKNAGLNRCGKSCRLRWTNYLRPDLKRGAFSQDEDRLIIHLHSLLGNKWSAMAMHLPGRTDNEIKNHWNTHLRKKLLRMGVDPVTHRRRTDLGFLAFLPVLLAAANITGNHEAPAPAGAPEARTAAAQQAMLQLLHNLLKAVASNASASISSDKPMSAVGSAACSPAYRPGAQLFLRQPRPPLGLHSACSEINTLLCSSVSGLSFPAEPKEARPLPTELLNGGESNALVSFPPVGSSFPSVSFASAADNCYFGENNISGSGLTASASSTPSAGSASCLLKNHPVDTVPSSDYAQADPSLEAFEELGVLADAGRYFPGEET